MLRAIDRIQKQIELQARLLGELPARVEISGPDGAPLVGASRPAYLDHYTKEERLQMERFQRNAKARMEGRPVEEDMPNVARPVALSLRETR
jgi:hypothetical protein